MKNATNEGRVYEELSSAGMTPYGHLKFASRYLHHFIRDDEHIMGVVYGRYKGGEAQLIATNQRVLFLDKKPLFVSSDEIAYEAISGVMYSAGGLFASVTLHARMGNYQLRYANKAAAARFVDYIEERLENRNHKPDTPNPLLVMLDDAGSFLSAHDLAVLSTVNRTGNASGAVVHYAVGPADTIYVLTRSETTKARNILNHSQVALTIFEAPTNRTLQLQGIAEVETDEIVKDAMFDRLSERQFYWSHDDLPPVMQLTQGVFVIFRIAVTAAAFHNYNDAPTVN